MQTLRMNEDGNRKTELNFDEAKSSNTDSAH